ncbi:MAG TPA: hypothetical protein PKD55_00135 [Bellilinea sp.]|nr:hypothetical protein [Bellilinea sp.]
MSVGDKIVAFLKKVGTILVDRRAIVTSLFVALLAFGGLFGLSPEQQEMLAESIGDLYTALVVSIESVASLFAAGLAVYKLIDSWTKRPPSGLDYKEAEAQHLLYGPKG